MRILWLCNICLPVIAKSLGMVASSKEGWLSGLSGELIRNAKENKNELAVCFPLKDLQPGTYQKGEVAGLTFYGFYENTAKETYYEKTMEGVFCEILEDYQPDLVHIFGTEFPHSLALAKAFGRPERTLIGLQGLCLACADHYMDGIPKRVQKRVTLRDFLKQDSIVQQQKKFYKRAVHETEALKLTGNVTGRTEFDRAYAKSVNAGARYHFMNETLRSEFYSKEWRMEHCVRHSIFVSQGDYPLKGLHLALEALPYIRKVIPDVKLLVGGNSIVSTANWKDRLKRSSYGRYLLWLIKKENLWENVTFTGMLNAEEMCSRMLSCHVFLSASMIENSPNSVGEAMLLGVPVVASEVGGVPDLLVKEEEGLFFPSLEANLLAHQVVRIFSDDALALKLSDGAKKRAVQTHNAKINYNRLLEIYHEIYHGEDLG